MKTSNKKIKLNDEAHAGPVAIHDTISLPTSREFDARGAMVAPASIARVGIMDYFAGDLGEAFKDVDPKKVIKVMTRDEDLFSEETMKSFRSAPITIGHPKEDVTTANASSLQYGFLEGMPTKLGDDLSAVVVLSHKDSLDLVQSKEAEQLSAGTYATIIRVSDEEAVTLGYDAYKKDIVCNHVAIVKRGRAGSARIADEENVKLHDELVEQVATLTILKDELEAKLDAEQCKLEDALKEVEVLRVKSSDEAIQRLVDEQVENVSKFLVTAVRMTDKDLTGLSVLEAKKVILQDNLKKDYSDKSEVFINNRFEALVEEGSNVSNLHQALQDHLVPDPTTSQEAENISAREQMILRHTKGNK